MQTKIVGLNSDVILFCPQCDAVWSAGLFFVEIVEGGDRFILAELCQCCGEIQLVVTLFDSQEPAQEAITRIIQNLAAGSNFSSLPLLSRDSALKTFPLEHLIA